jgi:hypothetical protein
MFTWTLCRRSTATGLGPRQTVIVFRNAVRTASRRPSRSASRSSAATPTPVMNTTMAKRPAQRASTNALTSAGCSEAVSRTAGTEYGTPPNRSTIAASSALMRASSTATRAPFRELMPGS